MNTGGQAQRIVTTLVAIMVAGGLAVLPTLGTPQTVAASIASGCPDPTTCGDPN